MSLELPQVCAACIEQAAALIGLGDVTEVQAQADELRAELARVAAERDQALAEREDSDAAVRALRAFERLGGGKSRTKAAA